MPIYAMQCTARCGHEEDIFRSVAERDRELPLCCGQPMTRKIVPTMVAPDIGAYQAVAVDVATGKAPVINSRSAHRDFLKRNGYIEVGNEPLGFNRKKDEVRGDFNVRGELTQATREVMRKQQ
jgi:hypothetical protein